MTYEDGKQYIGEFAFDFRNGQGKIIWADGSSYDGNWVTGKQSGEGYFTEKGGVTKKGFWVGGKRERWLDEGKLAARQERRCPGNTQDILD